MLPAPSLRKPALASLVFSLPSSASFFGCRGLAREGEAFSKTLVMASDFFRALSLRGLAAFLRILQLFEPLQRRGLPATRRSSAHHASAAKVPNIASGTSVVRHAFRKEHGLILRRDPRSRPYTLMLTILRITSAPRICMTTRHGQHFLAHRVGEQHHDVFGIELVDGNEQDEGQGQQHHAREPAFARQRLDLAPDAEAVADQLPDLVEDFGQIAAGLPLQDHGRDEELQVEVGNAVGQAAEGLVHAECPGSAPRTRGRTPCRSAAGISVATMLKPKARLWPARSVRASISRASGNCAANAFRRRLRRNSSHIIGSEPMSNADQRYQCRVNPHAWRQTPIPSTASTHRDDRELGDREVRIGLLE